jgi:hypothetical protein
MNKRLSAISPKIVAVLVPFGVAAAIFSIRPELRGAAAAVGKLDLDQYAVTFSEDFDDLSISARGPGTRWIAHTPWHGDFGDARFVDPTPGFPFTVDHGILRIEARKGADGKWQSGLICSRDRDGPAGKGFSQQYGYFEMSARLPEGPGVWPAFWLIGVDKTRSSTEIDVLEYYGAFPDSFRSTVHVYTPDHKDYGDSHVNMVEPGSLSSTFNTYGVEISPDWTIFYLNRTEVWRVETRPEFRQPMYVLVNLALGSGWPIDKTINPSYMYVDYVRAYSRRAGP